MAAAMPTGECPARGAWCVRCGGWPRCPPTCARSLSKSALEQGAAFLLDTYHLVEADYPARAVSRHWQRLNFPLFYQVDILFTLRVLGDLGALDRPGAQPALDWLAAQRRPDGRWRGVNPYGSRTWPALVDREETSRWVSLHAADVLKQAGRLEIAA